MYKMCMNTRNICGNNKNSLYNARVDGRGNVFSYQRAVISDPIRCGVMGELQCVSLCMCPIAGVRYDLPGPEPVVANAERGGFTDAG
jgi:hypothetical protein